MLAAKDASSTIRTMAFDRARGTLGWPRGIDGRSLFNDTVRDDDNGVDIEVVKTKFLEAVKKEDAERMLVWAGTGVGEMNEIKQAKVVDCAFHDVGFELILHCFPVRRCRVA